MAVEFEVKAWVSDVDAVRARLDRMAMFVRHFEKHDRYFARADAEEDRQIRIRSDGETTICTLKNKSLRGAFERNTEVEFRTNDGDQLLDFVRALGFRESIEKHKLGGSWACGDIVVELSHVSGLGDFVECELVFSDHVTEDELRVAQARIEKVLDDLHISPTAYEPRPYTALLRAQSTTGVNAGPQA